jgi:hypothetical protein
VEFFDFKFAKDYFESLSFYLHRGQFSKCIDLIRELDKYSANFNPIERNQIKLHKLMCSLYENNVCSAIQLLCGQKYTNELLNYENELLKILKGGCDLNYENFIENNLVFSRQDGSVISSMSLKKDGSIAGYNNPNESYWRINENLECIEFVDYKEVVSTMFFANSENKMLAGPFMRDFFIHQLEIVQ